MTEWRGREKGNVRQSSGKMEGRKRHGEDAAMGEGLTMENVKINNKKYCINLK